MTLMFERVTPKILQELEKIVGEENVIPPGGDLSAYSHDETEDFVFSPEVVVKPQNAEEISAILRLAQSSSVAVTPQAGRTSLSGGALPLYGGIALSIERMNRILEIDQGNLFAVVEPGVITQVLQEAVEEVGLFYPPDPSSRGSSTLGGNIAHCAGGPKALKYGVTKDWVYGLEVVLPSGEILRPGGKLLKNVAGYNLTQLFVGSEGTLGVVTKAILKLIPKPTFSKTVLVPFPDPESAATAVTKIFQAKIIPCACEYMERAAVEAAELRKGVKFPHSDAEALLLIEVDGNDEGVLDRDIEKIAEVCMECGAPDLFVALDKEKREFLWAMRRCIGEAVKKLSTYREEDTVVPRLRLPELVGAIREISNRHGIRAISYGHIGDGNIHVNLLRGDLSKEEWDQKLDPAVRDLFERTLSLGGQITGEHGVGYVQRNYMSMAYPPEYLDILRKMKSLFDPKGILNPGKIFPVEG